MMRLPVLALLALVVAACGVGQQWTAGRDEYRLYRETRIAPSEEARLGAAQSYLERYPNGVYRDDVRRYFLPAEEAYFYWSRDSLPRLRAYLAAMPRGPRARAVAARIVELESTVEFAQRRERRFFDKVSNIESSLSSAAQSRRRFLAEVSDWSRLLAGIRSFGEPTSRLDHELIYRFRLTEPRGSCATDRCRKEFTLAYEIPDHGKLLRREVRAAVELELDGGGVMRARLGAKQLMSRVGEALELRPLSSETLDERAEAIGRALTVVSTAVEAALPESRCAKAPVSPVVLLRECDGVRLVLVAGTSSSEDDSLIVEAVRPP
jgi:hypothetical protein